MYFIHYLLKKEVFYFLFYEADVGRLLESEDYIMKKLLAFLLSTVMLLSVGSTTAFAAESTPKLTHNTTEATMYNVELNSDGIVSITNQNGKRMPASSISGYNNGNITSSSNGFLVWVNASGTGGMGVTVTTSCSSWNGTITFDLMGNNGSHPISGQYISSNGSTEFHNLSHSSPAYYLANFSGIPSGHTIYAQVWIYG